MDRAGWRAPRACEYCGVEYRPKRRGQRFCRTTCRVDHHNEEKAKADPKVAALEKRVADLEAQMELVRGHLVL